MRDANTFFTGCAQCKVHDGFSLTKLCAAVRCFAPLVHVAATNDLVVHLLSCLHAPKRVSQTHNQRSQMASCLQVCCWQGFCVKLCCATGVSSRAGFVAIYQHTLYPPLPIQCCCCSWRQWVLVSMLSKWLSGTQRCCWSPNSAVHPLHVMNLLRSPPPPALFGMQLATVGAGVDVVKVVERQPALLLVDEASPLSDWSQLDQEELQQQIQVRLCVPVTSPGTG